MIKRGWHNHTGFVYSDWHSFGSEVGQHLRARAKLSENCFFLLAQATNVTAGTERTAHLWKLHSRGRLHWWNPIDTTPEGPGLQVSAAMLPSPGLFQNGAGASRGLHPQGEAPWFLAPPLFLDLEAIACGCLLCVRGGCCPFGKQLHSHCPDLAGPFNSMIHGLNLKSLFREIHSTKRKKCVSDANLKPLMTSVDIRKPNL